MGTPYSAGSPASGVRSSLRFTDQVGNAVALGSEQVVEQVEGAPTACGLGLGASVPPDHKFAKFPGAYGSTACD